LSAKLTGAEKIIDAIGIDSENTKADVSKNVRIGVFFIFFLASLLFNNKITSVTARCNTKQSRSNRWRS
jgi:hypothetical protein